jgi:hypothetical protein
MATITSAQSGNFTDTTTWVGGVVPGADDIAIAATGHVIAIDQDVTVTQVQQAGSGKFTLGNGRTLTGGVQANAGTFTSGGTVEVTATTTATIVGNLTGVSSTANNVAGVVVTGTGTLTINGNVTGAPGSAASEATAGAMLMTDVACTIIVNGQVVGGLNGWKYGILIGTNANTSLAVSFPHATGNAVTGGGGTGSYAIRLLGTADITVTGRVSGNSVIGILATGTAAGSITITGNLQGGGASNAVAVSTNIPLYVTGDITAGSPFVNFGHGVFCTSQVTVVGNIYGTPQVGTNGSSALILNSGGTAVVTGNVVGGNGTGGTSGISLNAANVTASVTGSVIGGQGSSAHAIIGLASTFLTVVGSVTATGSNSFGVSTSGTVILEGNSIDSPQGVVAIYTPRLRMTATNTGITQYANTVGFPNGELVSRVSPILLPGTPATNNVRAGTDYGYNDELTGTLAVPPANAVASGVPVDNTIGTAALSPADVAALVGAQIAAALDSVPEDSA